MSEETASLVLRPDSGNAGKRLDSFLSESIAGWSRARLQRLIDGGDVLVNGSQSRSSYKVRESDEIEVELTEISVVRFEPENIPLDIVFEDEYLVVINKPAGMIVHPGAGVDHGTLANAVAYHFGFRLSDFGPGDGDEQPTIDTLKSKIGLVHRLDKDTSGLIVVAKNEEIHEALSEQFQNRGVEKSYVALVHGDIRENSGKIDRPIARDRRNRLKMAVSQTGRSALTLWRVKQRFGKFTLLDVDIKTGRTHQIRVHLASLNHPIVGDSIYNEGRDNNVADIPIRQAIQGLGRFFLHAQRLSFTHPKTEERLTFTAELPVELTEFLAKL